MKATSGTAACAVCKHRRRRCNSDCPLAPYFPSGSTEEFTNVHRLFGLSNFTRLLASTPPELHADLVNSVKYESAMRRVFPVLGCVTVIRELSARLDAVSHELLSVRQEIQRRQQLYPPFAPPTPVLQVPDFATVLCLTPPSPPPFLHQSNNGWEESDASTEDVKPFDRPRNAG